ncbi:hypothetical protein [Azoarcus olearius]|uniref:Hypothetical secreted protein n=1 Tax=Azoarcus sp. (strain BH72) TaxID=418699 RepID=A1K4L9_AZOSB|nr:hypothetical protein [Azoarcus olearius]CAL93774.1 hypothetical secreted protein [Azoarcus olearius]
MTRWNRITDFLAHGTLVLPLVLGLGMRSFDTFALTLAPMLLLLIGVTLGAPAVVVPTEEDEGSDGDRR